MNDLRFAVRQLGKSPGFTAVAVTTLALGIGACAAIFSVVNSVLLQPLPFPDPDRLVVIKETFPPTLPESTVAPGRYLAWRDEASTLESVGALSGMSYNLTGAGEPEHLYAAPVTPSLLTLLGIRPALGRSFLREEGTAAYEGEPDVVMLSHGLWQSHFGGRADVLGQKLQMNGKSFTVVGVMPPGDSALPDRVEVFTPFDFPEAHRRNFLGRSLLVYARLKHGVTPGQTQSELAAIGERIAQAHPQTRGWGVKVTSLTEAVVGPVRPALLSLLSAVGFLLLIACANVANLLLARATARSREIAVRTALGARPSRIVRQISSPRACFWHCSVPCSALRSRTSVCGRCSDWRQRRCRGRPGYPVDGRALGFTVALAMVTGIAFGLVPAFQATTVRLQETLKQGGRGTSEGTSRHRLRSALVIAEVAIAIWLLVGAGLLMRSFARLNEVKPGFDPQGAHIASVFLPRPAYTSSQQHVLFANKAMSEIAALPGVKAVGVAANIPFSNLHLTLMTATTRSFTIVGRPPPTEAEAPVSSWYTVSPDYFRAMGIPVLRGRAFDARDVADAPRVAIISERVARKFFANQDPLGKSITIGWPQPREIVGVVADVKPKTLDGDSGFQTYEPFAQLPDNDIIFVVRTERALPGASTAIRSAIGRVDPLVPIYDARPMLDLVGSTLARQRFAMTLFLVFSAVALILAIIGIYGVMAYTVTQRTGEIGIRMALGAQTGQVLASVMGRGARLVVWGLLVGVVGALLLTRVLEHQSMLFGVHSYDPVTFAGIIILLASTAAAACFLPAIRAARLSPMTVLRTD